MRLIATLCPGNRVMVGLGSTDTIPEFAKVQDDLNCVDNVVIFGMVL